MKKGDWLTILLCLSLIPVSWTMTKRQPGITSAIQITANNRSPVIYSISTNQHIKVEGQLGRTIIEIRDGRVRISESPCSSKLCILSGWHQDSGDHIVCLPNKVGISLISQQDRFDGINF